VSNTNTELSHRISTCLEVTGLEKTRNGNPVKSLLHNLLEKGIHITGECNIQGELHKCKHGDGSNTPMLIRVTVKAFFSK
jgi:hypothetical protein